MRRVSPRLARVDSKPAPVDPSPVNAPSSSARMQQESVRTHAGDPNHINASFSRSCPHLSMCDPAAVLAGALFVPSEWACHGCRKQPGGDLWACLSCNVLACHGEDSRGHAAQHFRQKKHALFVDIGERQVFCLLCNEHVVDNNESDGVIAQLLDKLDKVRSGEYVLENGEIVRTGGQPTPLFKSRRFEDQDRLDTAHGHYRHRLLARTFAGWRDQAEKKRPRAAYAENPSGPKKPPKMILEPTASKVCAPGKTGLRNLGNTCFINSVVQCLSNLPALRDWLVNSFMDTAPIRYNNSVTLWRRGTIDCLTAMSSNVAWDQKEISMVVELHYILRVIWSGKWVVVTPYALLDALWRFVPHFRGYVQQDAQEFFSYLLDRINTELTEAMKNIVKPFAAPGPVAEPSVGQQSSIVNQIFEGMFVSEVACSKCKNVTRRSETFVDLELDVIVHSVARRRAGPPEATTLEQCLASFSRWEKIEDYACEKCRKPVVAQKRIMIARLPQVLCIVLKRFCYTAAGSLAKNDAGVVFPLQDLDVSSICCADMAQPIAPFHLRSLIVHSGLSLRKGHYFSVCYNNAQDCWLQFNDAKVTTMTEESVAKQEAYMLFYSSEDM